MSKKIKEVLKGLATTMELLPPDAPAVKVTSPAERIRKSWERTGEALQRTMSRFEREQSAK